MSRFTLKLSNPDDIIIKQDDNTSDIYFMVNGEASVSMQNTMKQPLYNFKFLTAGDHFGEISALYGCKRTATIEAQDYCTFAVLTKDDYDKTAGEVPEVKNEMKKYVLEQYNQDEVKLWAFESLL